MAVPAVSVGSHERYGPEIRDRILAKLQAPADRTSYQMLTPARLRALVDIESPRAPVVSFYLQLSPHRRVRRVWHAAFNSHASATLKRVASRREREALKEEIDRIEGALQAELPALGHGVAFFTCEAVGLWQQIAVAVPLTDGVHLGPRPHIRPLVRTRDEHDRFVLALLSLEHSRFFISQIGQVQEVLQVKGQSLKRVLTERALRDRGDVLDSEAARNEARLLAHAAELVLAQFEGRHLLVAGPPELRATFSGHLPKAVRQRFDGEFTVAINGGPSEIAAAAAPAQSAVEEHEEVATLQRLIEAGPAVSAWGEGATFDALRDRRVTLLAVDDRLAMPGARCGECGQLWEPITSYCPTCRSGTVETLEDVVEVAIEQALEQDAALELVRSGPARRLMTGRGAMAALLRW